MYFVLFSFKNISSYTICSSLLGSMYLELSKIYIKMHITKIYRWRHKILDYAQSTYVSPHFRLTLKENQETSFAHGHGFRIFPSNNAGIKHIKLALTWKWVLNDVFTLLQIVMEILTYNITLVSNVQWWYICILYICICILQNDYQSLVSITIQSYHFFLVIRTFKIYSLSNSQICNMID